MGLGRIRAEALLKDSYLQCILRLLKRPCACQKPRTGQGPKLYITCSPQQVLSFTRLIPQAEDGTSPVTEAITAAVREAGGRAFGGKAVFVPLLERCKTETTVQIARAPHPTLPSLRAQLSVPRLRFFVSAARVRRLMRVLRSALPGRPSNTDMRVPQ